MGSVVIVGCRCDVGSCAFGLPAALGYTGDLSLQGHVAEHVPADAEEADVALGAACELAAVVHAHPAAVRGQLLQAVPVASGLQRSTFGGVLLHHLGPLALTCLH